MARRRSSPLPPPEPARPRPFVPLLPYQRVEVESRDRFRWCCWSRQIGKSFALSLRRILRGIQRRRDQLLISAGERQSRELLQKVRMHCRAMNILADARGLPPIANLGGPRSEVMLAGRVRVIALPANPLTVRGYTGDVLLDEFAMHRDDRAIWAAVYPSILRNGGELDIASTPRGKGNLFYRLRGNDAFGRSTVTLPQAVAAGLNVDIDAVRRGLADELLFRQEFLCEFLDEAHALLSFDTIAACEDARLTKTPEPQALSAQPDLFAGVDVGRRRDLTVIWLLQRDAPDRPGGTPQPDHSRPGDSPAQACSADTQITGDLITRAVIELECRPFREQFDALAELFALPGLRRCAIDAGGIGMQLAEQLEERFGAHLVERVTLTAALKEQLAGRLRVLAEAARIRIPPCERIREDWHSIRRLVGAAGHVRYDAARTDLGHGDRFWAAALAVYAAGNDPGPVTYEPVAALRFARRGTW